MKLSLNLATRTYLNRRLLYAAYGAAIVLLLGGLAGFGAYFWRCHQQSRTLRAAMARMEQQSLDARGGAAAPFSTQEYQRVLQRITLFNQVLDKKSLSWTHLLGRLESLVPPGIGLRSLQPDFKARSLKITGLARNLDKLQAFLDNLLAAKDFSTVYLLDQARLNSAPSRRGRGNELSFSIVVEGAF